MKSINRLIFGFFSALTAIFMVGCSSSSTDGTFSISGKLEGLDAPYFMCAIEFYADSIVVDTVRVNAKGEFNYRSKVNGITKTSLYFSQKQLSPIFVDQNLDVKIEGNVSDIYALKIEGGDVNEAIAGFRSRNRKLIETNSPLLVDSVQGYIKNNKESLAGIALLDLYLRDRISLSKQDSLVRSVSDLVLDIPYTKNLLSDISEARQAEVGAPARGFIIKNTKGKEIKLADYSNKTILLTFVEKEDSLLLNLYSDIEKENPKVSVLSFMMETDKAKIKDAKRSYLHDGKGWASNIVSDYRIKAVPSYVLIDSSQQIRNRGKLDANVLKILQNLRGK